MKLFALTFIAAFLSITTYAQTLSGKRVSRDIPVSSFNALKANGALELNLVQGSKESVTVEGDETLQAYITIANNGNTLEVDTKRLNNKNIRGNWKLRVTVYFRNLSSLNASTVGNVVNEGTLQFDDLKLDLSSVGNTNLKLTANKLQMDAKSVGNIELSGSAKTAILHNSSIGNLEAEGFKIGSLEITNNSIGNTDLNAESITKLQSGMIGKMRNRGQKMK